MFYFQKLFWKIFYKLHCHIAPEGDTGYGIIFVCNVEIFLYKKYTSSQNLGWLLWTKCGGLFIPSSGIFKKYAISLIGEIEKSMDSDLQVWVLKLITRYITYTLG